MLQYVIVNCNERMHEEGQGWSTTIRVCRMSHLLTVHEVAALDHVVHNINVLLLFLLRSINGIP